jgi:uncharacterized membrane protein YcaP (DUF421 family)
VNPIVHALIGDLPAVGDVAIKTTALFFTAAILFRFTERRTLAEFAPFDWIAAVAAGAIVGRAATATDTAWLPATTALLCLLAAHAVLARLRLIPALCRFIDPPLMVLIRDGEVNRRTLRRCGLTTADLEAVLREHGHPNANGIYLAILEAKGAISVLASGNASCHPTQSRAATASIDWRRHDGKLGCYSPGTCRGGCGGAGGISGIDRQL